MMGARYLFRMDDITPTMNWRKFWRVLSVFERRRITPLLGLVPDNRDTRLDEGPAHPDFWTIMSALASRGSIEVAQHGYQHILKSRPGAGILNTRFDLRDWTEFAGDPYEDQVRRIRLGQSILERHGLTAKFWIAPNHSFDQNTLKALDASGFTAVSDGIALFPYRQDNLIFIPQQFWRPRRMPCGVVTVCLHANSISNADVRRLEGMLDKLVTFTSFAQEVDHYRPNHAATVFDRPFAAAYRLVRRAKPRCSSPRDVDRPELQTEAL